jgi:hypothetical protein
VLSADAETFSHDTSKPEAPNIPETDPETSSG